MDAPIQRVEAVLSRDPNLMRLVRNEWVRLIVRDTQTNQFFERQPPGEYVPIISDTAETHIDFDQHRNFGLMVAGSERLTYHGACMGAGVAYLAPLALHYNVLTGAGFDTICFDQLLADPTGALIATSATVLTVSTLSFARRYMHGEYFSPAKPHT